jgi:hypothetical protein
MKCKENPENLISLLYGEIDKKETERIRAHLKKCKACQEAFKELKSTTQILEKWEDRVPAANYLFMKEPEASWKTKWKQMGLGRKLVFGLPAAALLLFLSLALLNFEASFKEGEWQLSFGLFPKNQTALNQQILTDAVQQAQQETLLLISDLLADRDYRQQLEFSKALSQMRYDFEQKRMQDLRLVGQGLEGLQRSTEGKFNQTNEVLSDLIQLAGYRIERK